MKEEVPFFIRQFPRCKECGMLHVSREHSEMCEVRHSCECSEGDARYLFAAGHQGGSESLICKRCERCKVWKMSYIVSSDQDLLRALYEKSRDEHEEKYS